MFYTKDENEQYLLLDEGETLLGPLAEVAVCFDLDTFTVHKHGAPAEVFAWQKQAREKFLAAGFYKEADAIVALAGTYEVEELNKIISCSGYMAVYYRKVIAPEVAQLNEVCQVIQADIDNVLLSDELRAQARQFLKQAEAALAGMQPASKWPAERQIVMTGRGEAYRVGDVWFRWHGNMGSKIGIAQGFMPWSPIEPVQRAQEWIWPSNS